ncbi:hypothetical protein M1N08_01725 [Dehalococcoidia bacterium]|nr:hypothetical protein [Dehalococcoidia bacterium]
MGGEISKSPDNRENRLQLFRLRLYSSEAKKFLERLLPYLKIKKEQARLAIEFQSKMEKGKLTIPKEEQEKYRIQINQKRKRK